MLHRGIEKGRYISYLLVHEIDKPNAPPLMIHLGAYDVERVEWGNDERLLLWILVHVGADGQLLGIKYPGGFLPTPSRRMLALGADGGDSVLLFSGQPELLGSNYDLGDIVDPLLDDPRHVLVQTWDGRHGRYVLEQVDIYTGVGTEVERGVEETYGWLTQKGLPVLRYDAGFWGTVKVYARAPGEREWKFFKKLRRDEFQKLDGLDVVATTPEAGVLLVTQTPPGENFQAVRRFDLRTLEVGEVFKRRPGFDLEGLFCDAARNPVAECFTEDRATYAFLDPVLDDAYQQIVKTFDKTCNVAPIDISQDHGRIVLTVSGPRTPTEYWSCDLHTRALKALGRSMPWLPSERLAPTEILNIETRSKARLTAYLSTPIAAAVAPRPLVVLPHGGPEMRDSVDFDMFVQALAAQGWLVLQPNFRGSGGYGRAFADAGRRHWGDLMQEDVEDCVAHLVASGRADPRKIAICGISYGGYAALMGSARQPDLYRATVSIAGPSDLLEFLSWSRKESGADSPTYAYWLKTIGDPGADQDMLKTASPARRAGDFKAPVLLIHGTEDKIVPARQSVLMAQALTKAGRSVEHVELKGFGHRGWNAETWTKVMETSIAHIATAFA
ncbi:hypothetical protein ASD21_18800 [Caulobacter sp. Root1455]|nr:hypothetical protein ASD21_18800 [Caulobacter sp. Root1455]